MNAHEQHGHLSAPTSLNGHLKRLGGIAADKADEVLSEVPATLRRLRTLLLVLAVTVPVCALALLFIAWRLVS